VLSIGSVGSVLSIGSIGSAGSLLSIGSACSAASALSFAARGSLLSSRARGCILGSPMQRQERLTTGVALVAVGVAFGFLRLAIVAGVVDDPRVPSARERGFTDRRVCGRTWLGPRDS
jgi:hypothetical protein